MPTKRITRADALFAAALAAALVFLIAKCPYGIGYYDESFYLSTARRMVQGDAMIAQEWNQAQMFTLFTAPLVALYQALGGGLQGIILAFRYVFVAVQGLAAVFVYARLRRYGRAGAAGAALAFCLFAPYNITALSYNSVGILCMVLAGTLAATLPAPGRRRTVALAAAGALYAGAVLCCPFLALGYFILAALWLLRRRKAPGLNALFLPFTGGIAGLAVIFFAFVFSRTGLILFLKGVRTMLQHTDRSSEAFGQGLLFCTTAAPVLFAALALLALLLWRDKARTAHRPFYLISAGAVVLGFQLSFWVDGPYLNFFMFAINLLPPFVVLTAPQPDAADRKLLLGLWAPGLFYAFAISLASNQKFYALSAACTVAAVGSIVIVARAIARLWPAKAAAPRAAVAVLALVLAAQGATQLYTRWQGVFWQDPPAALTVRLTEGPQAGLLTDAESAQEYTDTLAATAPLRQQLTAQDTVAFISRKTWLYLSTPARVGSCSSWLQLGDGIRLETIDQLDLYYDRYPEKLPTAVYVEDAYADVMTYYCETYAYTAQPVAGGWILTR